MDAKGSRYFGQEGITTACHFQDWTVPVMGFLRMDFRSAPAGMREYYVA